MARFRSHYKKNQIINTLLRQAPRYQLCFDAAGNEYWYRSCPICGQMGPGCFHCGWNLTESQRRINLLIAAATYSDALSKLQ